MQIGLHGLLWDFSLPVDVNRRLSELIKLVDGLRSLKFAADNQGILSCHPQSIYISWKMHFHSTLHSFRCSFTQLQKTGHFRCIIKCDEVELSVA